MANGSEARLQDSKRSHHTSTASFIHIVRFWLRLPKTATETFRRRFYSTWVDYVECVVKQAQYRSKSRILDLEDFLVIRRHTSGAPSTIAFYEMHSDIPDHIREHPIILELETIAVDLIVIANVRQSRLSELCY